MEHFWTMQLIDPTTEATETIPETSCRDLDFKVSAARKAQSCWGANPVSERARILGTLSQHLQDHAETLVHTIARDMGKPFRKGVFEVQITLGMMRNAVARASEWLSPEEVDGGFVWHEPLGVAAVISPWNFPLYTSFSAIVPALLAGNAVVFKPSENAVRTGLAIADLFGNLDGFCADAFQIVVGGKEHGRRLVDGEVDIVAFTGSSAAGKEIMARSANRLHRLVLELGGLDAALVLQDADINWAANRIVRSNCFNSGQVCCAAKRAFVEESVYDAFVEAAVREAKGLSVGEPHQDIDMGPLVAKFQMDKVEELLQDAVAKGARVMQGGSRLPRSGYFFPPTILTNVNREMRLMVEEPFGPVLPISPVASWEEGVQRANETRYGLSASIWTRNTALAKEIAARLEVGVVGINSHGPGAHGTPWGGAKESGIGRVNSREGMLGFTNTKLVTLP
ncbi:MAG TPA: aldehyde dehydrogenase family protein [Terracidiphilus sp.]|jgi:acyl-CoA reductase-like NAD-dependent aldehyde dehydrogenase